MATVVRKTTGEAIGGVSNLALYPVADWLHNPDLSALQAVDPSDWKVVNGAVVEMTQAEKDAGFVLGEYKTATMKLVDVECGRRIYGGIVYGGITISLSFIAQLNFAGLDDDDDRDDEDDVVPGRMKYPFPMSGIDNQAGYNIVDADDAEALYDLAYKVKRDHIYDCNTVKANVRGAVDKAAVDAATAGYLP